MVDVTLSVEDFCKGEVEFVQSYRKSAFDLLKQSPAISGKKGITINFPIRFQLDSFKDVCKNVSCVSLKQDVNAVEIITDFSTLSEDVLEQFFDASFEDDCRKDAQHYFHESFFTDTLFVRIPKGVVLEKPLLISIDVEKTCLQNIFVLAEGNSQVSLVVTKNIGRDVSYFSEHVKILAKQNAIINYTTLTQCEVEVPIYQERKAQIDGAARVDWLDLSVGSLYNKTSVVSDLNAEDATTNNTILFLAKGKQIQDIYTASNHNNSYTHSNIVTKGALTDNARALSTSMVKINKNAPFSNGFEQQDALLLSPHSEADAIPMLEINNNEVKCSHGSTIGQIDKDKLFYLMSRGVSEREAKAVLVRGYFEPIFAAIVDEQLKEDLELRLEAILK